MSDNSGFWEANFKTRAEVQLKDFAKLPAGWHFGEGGPIDAERIDAARRIVTTMRLQGFRKIEAFPGPDGGVGLTAVHGKHIIELFVEPDDTFSITHEEGDVEHESVEHQSWTRMREALRRAVRRVWPLSDGYTRSTGVPKPDVLAPTSTRTYAAECRLLRQSAPSDVPG